MTDLPERNGRGRGSGPPLVVAVAGLGLAVALLWFTVDRIGGSGQDGVIADGGAEPAGPTDDPDGAETGDTAGGVRSSGDGGPTDRSGSDTSDYSHEPDDPDGDPGGSADRKAEPEPHQRPLPQSASALAEALTEAELAVRDPALTNAQLDSWGRRQQTLYRHLSFNADWAPTVIPETDAAVRDAVTLNWEARQNLSALVDTETLHDELPAWRIERPLPPQTLIGYYKQAEADTGISWEFLAAINLVETRMGRIEGISTAGAIGPMQFLPTTWAECCDGDPSVPADAIAGAALYLTIRGGPDNMDRAIFGYNNSQYYVDAVTAYATVMMENERAYYGYHAWEIYFKSTEGLIRIPVGYEQAEPIAATTWLAEHPDTLFSE